MASTENTEFQLPLFGERAPFSIKADAGDHLWPTAYEIQDRWLDDSEPAEIYSDHWKESLGYALAGALIFSMSLAPLIQQIQNPPLTR